MKERTYFRNLIPATVALFFPCLLAGVLVSPSAAQETDHIYAMSHIGVAVKDIEKSVADLKRVFAVDNITIEDVKPRKMKVAFIEFEGVEIEFMQDYSEDGAMAKAVREKGDHINHFCLKTKNIAADIATLKKRGVEFQDQKPRVGLTKKWVAYTKENTIGGLAFELLQPYPEPPK